MNIVQTPSPNFAGGRWFGKPSFIVIHSIVGRMSHADGEFLRRGSKKSAHYAVDGDLIHQYVNEKDTAFHSGARAFFDRNNQKSIGIETAGGGRFGESTELTYRTIAQLVSEVLYRHGLPLSRETVRPHKAVASTECPSGINMDKLFSYIEELRQPKPVPAPIPEPVQAPVAPDTRAIAIFPITITITVPSAYVRKDRSTLAPVYTKLSKNNSIKVYDRVAGQLVNGSEVWLKTLSGNWIHESVTNFKQVLNSKNWR